MRTLCDVCGSAAAIFFCAADEAALCRACDEKFPGDRPGLIDDVSLHQANQGEIRSEQNQTSTPIVGEKEQNHVASVVPNVDANNVADVEMDNKLIDLNARPQRVLEPSPTNQGMDFTGAHDDSTSVVALGSFKRKPEK